MREKIKGKAPNSFSIVELTSSERVGFGSDFILKIVTY
jgi:hypothetical protein